MQVWLVGLLALLGVAHGLVSSRVRGVRSIIAAGGLVVENASPFTLSMSKKDVNDEDGNKTPLYTLIAVVSGLVISNILNIPYETAADVQSKSIKQEVVIKGRVMKVIDGDTVRIRHLPTFYSSPSFKGNIKDHTIVIRATAVDTPEKGQKYGIVAKDYVASRLMNKDVKVKIYGKDQYNRILGRISYDNGKDLSTDLVKEGLGAVYRQGGAIYRPENLEYWNKLEQTAKDKRKGMWKDGEKNTMLPSEYKKLNSDVKLSKRDREYSNSKRNKFSRTGTKADSYLNPQK